MNAQGTEAWRLARLGKVGASRVADVVARTKTGWGASRANLMAELMVERLTGMPAESYTSAAMQFGIDTEPQARAAYIFHTDANVTEVGFIDHPTIPMTGCSPDGCIDDDGLLEIKAPNTSTHLDTLLGAPIPAKYITQVQWQMSVTGRKWCDWVSFDPRLPEAMRLVIHRVARDDTVIASLEDSVREFLAELDEKMAKLTARYPMHKAAAA